MNNSDLPIFTKSQLALRNGQDKKDIWVACNGIIYDVTQSKMWKHGLHYGNWAGQDLTKEIENHAPHSKNVLNYFKIVGKLKS